MRMLRNGLRIGLATAALSGLGMALQADPVSPHIGLHFLAYRLFPSGQHTGIVGYLILYGHIVPVDPEEA